MKILYIGESWLGSCARSLREALARQPSVELDDLAEDAFFPKPRALWLRALNRVIVPTYRKEFNAQVLERVHALQPDVVMVYKGNSVRADLLAAIRAAGTRTVNVYPDCSPHAHGDAHRLAVGDYDLVISTKPYHPSRWHDVYGYDNRCVFVPQGYDPVLHLVADPPADQPFDVVMAATCRKEYAALMIDFAHALGNTDISVAIAGKGWEAARSQLPANWHFLGSVAGRRYIAALRQGKICIAPLTRQVEINGCEQPGDVDSTRTYELAAAHCFFIHRRTDYVQSIYDDTGEVPMFDNAEELAQKVRHFLARSAERGAMAAAAHRRAVPAYSLDQRAAEIVDVVKGLA